VIRQHVLCGFFLCCALSVRFLVVVLELGVSFDSKRERGGEEELFVPFLGGIAVLKRGQG